MNFDISLNNTVTENLYVNKDEVISPINTKASRSLQQNADTEVEYMNSSKNQGFDISGQQNEALWTMVVKGKNLKPLCVHWI